MVEEVLQAAAESLFRELAAAGGGRVVNEAELFREGHLGFAAAAGEAEQLGTVEEALLLWDRRFKQLGREGTDEAALESGTGLHDAERLAVLGHGALVEDLARGDEVVAEPGHQFARARDHLRVAVDAGVHRAAETVGGIGDEGEFVVREVDDAEGDAEGGGGLPRGGGREERGLEGDALPLGAGGAKDADGELRIKPA